MLTKCQYVKFIENFTIILLSALKISITWCQGDNLAQDAGWPPRFGIPQLIRLLP